MKMNKKTVIFVATAILSIAMGITSFAGQWKKDHVGWWWQEDNGSYPTNSWKEINGKWYYFDDIGYMLANTTTPDGYKVGVDGAWIQDNSTVVKSIKDEYIGKLSHLSVMVGTNDIYYKTYSKRVTGGFDVIKANIDGSNAKIVVSGEWGGLRISPDNKFYYISYSENALRRCNMDGTNNELLYVETRDTSFPGIEYKVPKRLMMSGSNDKGIQLDDVFFEYSSGRILQGQYVNSTTSTGVNTVNRNETIPAQVRAIIPNKKYDRAVMSDHGGGIVSVLTQRYVPNGWPNKYYEIGRYLINTNSNTCIYYEEGYPLKDNRAYRVTELGLFVDILEPDRKGLYRMEDGGNLVKILDYRDTDFVIKNNCLYSNNYGELNILHLEPIALPTKSAV